MINGWVVIWFQNHRKYKKNGFEGDSPSASGAIDYAKKVVTSRGIPVKDVHIVSKRKAFGPSQKALGKREPGSLWCPYCLKWRFFHISSVMNDGIVGPELMRCPICTISVNDYYVKKYNATMVARIEQKPVRVGKAKVVPARRR